MTTSVRAACYCEEEASQQLICQEVCRVLATRGHSVTVVVLSRGNEAEEPKQHCHTSELEHSSSVSWRCLSVQQAPPGERRFVEAEAAWLRTHKVQVVVSASVPWAYAAAAAAGVCSVCLAHSTGGKTPDKFCPHLTNIIVTSLHCCSALLSAFPTSSSIA